MVRFAVFSDIHGDIIDDAPQKLEGFLKECEQNNVDFVLQLGDFVQPPLEGKYTCDESKVTNVMRRNLLNQGMSYAERNECVRMCKSAPFDIYHVLGNHDLDLYNKDQIREFLGMPSDYYSFDYGGIHFIALDLNYMKSGEDAESFANGNYLKWYMHPDAPLPYAPKKELEWLANDLKKNELPVVIFSHEGFTSGFINAINAQEIMDIIEKDGKTILCIYGHKHQDLIGYERNIPVYALNSMSGYSLPQQYFPVLMARYNDSLYSIVNIYEDRIVIEGRSSFFMAPTPEELRVSFDEPSIKLTAQTSSCVFERKK